MQELDTLSPNSTFLTLVTASKYARPIVWPMVVLPEAATYVYLLLECKHATFSQAKG
jgi:hypothetical protein